METTGLKQEMEKLCDMQAEHWNCLKDALAVFDESDEKGIYAMYQRYFKDNTEALDQLLKVKKMTYKFAE